MNMRMYMIFQVEGINTVFYLNGNCFILSGKGFFSLSEGCRILE